MSHSHDALTDMSSLLASDNAQAAKQYFRSLEQLAETPEYRELAGREFPDGAAEWSPDLSRRHFLNLVAASVALAGLQGCRKPVQHIVPFGVRPEGYSQGVPVHYASAFVAGGYGYGTLVRSNDGRPTKVEGNPAHPATLGAANQYMQADVLNLYDPARSRHPVKKGSLPVVLEHAGGHGGDAHGAAPATDPIAAAWAEFEAFFAPLCKQLRAEKQGEGTRFLLEPTTSPTQNAWIAKAQSVLPKAGFHFFTPLHRDHVVAGSKLAFGHALEAHHLLDKADCVLALDSDFLALDVDALATARRYAKKRKITEPGQQVARLYVVESTYSVTGASADHRFRVPASRITDVALALAAELLGKLGAGFEGLGDDLRAALKFHGEHGFKTAAGKDWVAAVAKDLLANKGKSCVLAGVRQPPLVHALVHALNSALGNQGQTVVYTQTDPGLAIEQTQSIQELAAAIDGGKVETLFCLGTNPVYHAPADLDFASKLAKVKTVVHLGLHYDETARLATWHVNQAHDLESWGDIRAYDGTISAIQPLIAPLYDGKTAGELLARISGVEKASSYDLVRSHWKSALRMTNFEADWTKALHDGVVAGTAAEVVKQVGVSSAALAKAVAAHARTAALGAANLEITFHQDARLEAGRFSNNAWMMELPDPLSKLTWDNAALISLETAKALGVGNHDMLRIALDGRSLEVPVWILPGQADWSIALMLGYGRTLTHEHAIARSRPEDEVAHGGFNTFALRTTKAQWIASGGSVARTGAVYQLAPTQDHGALEGRPLLREGTAAEFQKNPEFAYLMSPLARKAKLEMKREAAHGGGHGETTHAPKEITEDTLLVSLWEEQKYAGDYQWAMVIDLNSCIGCNACVVACQAENNIPTVGKKQVLRNREMHWIRIDRYFGGLDGKAEKIGGLNGLALAAEPSAAQMPVPCMQCENAPCEAVCPVNATTHTPDGLNDMAYNRCVGTRYCSNNCPYKVRRFNFLGYTNRYPETIKMANNPDVTVRSRGVMEKCTYCVQRITAGRLAAKTQGRLAKDGEITPACGQTCPTQAITFGNLVEKDSRVNQLRKSKLNYAMLGDLNVKPRTTYLAKIRNPNPELV